MSIRASALQWFNRVSLRNKLMISMLVAVLFISATIAFVARWILVSSLTDELELRGNAIAHSVADKGASYILDNDIPNLLLLIFNEVGLHERKNLVSYIFVEDRNGEVLAHTLIRRLPDQLRDHRVPNDKNESIRLTTENGHEVYDIAVSIREGLYRIGTVHVGLSKAHIDKLISKLRFAFLGFISGVIIITLILSSQLTKRITRPVSDLTRLANEISRGNFDLPFAKGGSMSWNVEDCPAFTNTDLPCWHLDQFGDGPGPDVTHPTCGKCVFYHSIPGDEVVQLGNSFRSMVWSIRLYRHRLRESEEKYRSLFDSGPDPVFVVNALTGTILDANPRAEELYGYEPGELPGSRFADLGNEDDVEFMRYFRECGESGCIYYPKQIHTKKNGEPFFVNMHACPISYRGNPSVIVAATDITEMIEKDAQLIQAAKMKTLGEMSAGVAHELNQPLNAIKMGTEYLSMESEGTDIPTEQRTDVLREIGVQVDRASEIINTLRAFGRKSDMAMESMDLNDAINAVLSILRRQFELDNIHFELNLSADIPPINGHSNRLQQVFFNLISNAHDAINEHCKAESPISKRRITIRTSIAADIVFAEVEDTGGGIPAEMQSKIFEPFFTTKETGQGMGLGLAISYGIVKDYNGDIEIDSRLGQGTIIRLKFPTA